jgi:hypothetical protein
MKDMRTLWDVGSSVISRVMDTIVPTRYMMVYDDSMINNNVQGYSMVLGSVQSICGVFPLGKPPDIILEHTIELRFPRISECMVEA